MQVSVYALNLDDEIEVDGRTYIVRNMMAVDDLIQVGCVTAADEWVEFTFGPRDQVDRTLCYVDEMARCFADD